MNGASELAATAIGKQTNKQTNREKINLSVFLWMCDIRKWKLLLIDKWFRQKQRIPHLNFVFHLKFMSFDNLLEIKYTRIHTHTPMPKCSVFNAHNSNWIIDSFWIYTLRKLSIDKRHCHIVSSESLCDFALVAAAPIRHLLVFLTYFFWNFWGKIHRVTLHLLSNRRLKFVHSKFYQCKLHLARNLLMLL